MGELTKDMKEWRKIVKERTAVLEIWEKSRGHWREEVVERNVVETAAPAEFVSNVCMGRGVCCMQGLERYHPGLPPEPLPKCAQKKSNSHWRPGAGRQ